MEMNRYQYFLELSLPAEGWVSNVLRGNRDVQRIALQLIDQLEKLHIHVRVDLVSLNMTREAWILNSARNNVPAQLALTYAPKGHSTLILIVVPMHRSWEELLDTLLHEAIHALGPVLDRYSDQPERTDGTAYWLEEVCAWAGAEKLGALLALGYSPEFKARQRRELEAHQQEALQSGADVGDILFAYDAADIAVNFLCSRLLSTSWPRNKVVSIFRRLWLE